MANCERFDENVLMKGGEPKYFEISVKPITVIIFFFCV